MPGVFRDELPERAKFGRRQFAFIRLLGRYFTDVGRELGEIARRLCLRVFDGFQATVKIADVRRIPIRLRRVGGLRLVGHFQLLRWQAVKRQSAEFQAWP